MRDVYMPSEKAIEEHAAWKSKWRAVFYVMDLVKRLTQQSEPFHRV